MTSASQKRTLVAVVATLFSEFVALVLLWFPPIPEGSTWLGAFRGYFPFDQLSYAGIASTAAAGNLGSVEPFTETGASFYPSLWYKVLGLFSSVTGGSVTAAWTIAGMTVVGLAILIIGLVALRVSNRAWAPALVGPALCVGTLSTVLHAQWFTQLDSHAVLWGPYGALYTLNAEVIGFALAATGLSLALLVGFGRMTSRGLKIVVLSVAALLIGVIASVQTYAFFVAIAMLFTWAGGYGLAKSRSRAAAIATAILIVLTFALGSFVNSKAGAIPVFGLLILCTLPGLWLAVKGHVRPLLIPAILLVASAAPQFLLVAGGILDNNEFLTYRQDQSTELTVSLIAGLIAALPIIAVWFYNLVVIRRKPEPVLLGLLLGLAFTWFMLSFNNLWGFAQEPYRLWIDSVAIGALVLAPITAISLAKSQKIARKNEGRRPTIIRVAGIAALVLFGASLMDVGGFRIFAANQGVIPFDTNRMAALESVSAPVDGLMAAEPCIDPQHLKVATRKPVAFYNMGIAWPENKAGIDQVMAAAAKGTFSPEALQAGGVTYLVTDTSCPTKWVVEGTMGAVKVQSLDYADPNMSGTLTLWKLN